MLEVYREFLNTQKIVLLSGSPRRKELLEQIGLKFTCQASGYDERELNPAHFSSMADFVTKMAMMKMRSVKVEGDPAYLIITADTIVVSDGEVYGKPETEEKAIQTLQKLSGRTHEVFTGVALNWTNTRQEEDYDHFSCCTTVKMADLSESDIKAYVKTGEPLDKAGAYGIQALGGCLVEWVNGDFYNVAGLPLHEFSKHVALHLKKENIL